MPPTNNRANTTARQTLTEAIIAARQHEFIGAPVGFFTGTEPPQPPPLSEFDDVLFEESDDGLSRELLELERQEEEAREVRRRRAAMPITVSMQNAEINGMTMYFVRGVQGGVVIDEFRERDKARALRSFATLKREYAERAARAAMDDHSDSEVTRVVMIGERVAHALRNRRDVRRPNRREHRPEDDVITEEGLTLSIEPDAPKKATTARSSMANVFELELARAAADIPF